MAVPRPTPVPDQTSAASSSPIRYLSLVTRTGTWAPTKLPALTTPYIYSTECSNRWLLYDGEKDGYSSNGSRIIYSGPQAGYAINKVENFRSEDTWYTSCQPYSTDPLYSPGVCPDRHTVAEATIIYKPESDGSTKTWWWGLCCSIGFDLSKHDTDHFCAKTFGTPFQVQVAISSSFFLNGTSVQFVTEDFERVHAGSTIRSYSTVTSGLAIADPVKVLWQSSDFSRFPADYATMLAEQIGLKLSSESSTSANQTETYTPLPTLPALETDGKANMKAGVIAGIAVGGALGLVFVVALVYIFLRRRRKQKEIAPVSAVEDQTIPEMDQSQDLAGRMSYLGGKWRNEAEAVEVYRELNPRPVNVISETPVELEASEQVAKQDAKQDVKQDAKQDVK